jgi:hypothetical protein
MKLIWQSFNKFRELMSQFYIKSGNNNGHYMDLTRANIFFTNLDRKMKHKLFIQSLFSISIIVFMILNEVVNVPEMLHFAYIS